MFELGTSKAKEAFSLYGRIDILRPYFDVEPVQVQKRLISALIPEKLTGTPPIIVRYVIFSIGSPDVLSANFLISTSNHMIIFAI